MPEIVAPGGTVGILGGGQLGRMLALAAARLGLRSHVYAPEGDNPAFDVAARHTAAAYDDDAALERFARSVDVVTFEFENVPAPTVERLAASTRVAPSGRALAVSQDRLAEKTFIAGLGIPVAPFTGVDSEANLQRAIAKIGCPSILKTRRFGYDGKGQAKILEPGGAEAAWRAVGGKPSVIEGLVPFAAELSVIAARGHDGSFAAYDVPLNVHANHILATSTVPARLAPSTLEVARHIARTIADGLDYVGIIGVELFLVREGSMERLIVNEIAPRVHNSGHWTLDACTVSQFEQHIRAVAGWPLGDPSRHSDAVMHNLIGDEAHAWREWAARPGAAVHLYGKAEARPGRKMGHVTVVTRKT